MSAIDGPSMLDPAIELHLLKSLSFLLYYDTEILNFQRTNLDKLRELASKVN